VCALSSENVVPAGSDPLPDPLFVYFQGRTAEALARSGILCYNVNNRAFPETSEVRPEFLTIGGT
jgi:hypothetical protein